MPTYFDRYSRFRRDGKVLPMPYLSIPIESTDKAILYELGKTRLDKISLKYYNNPYSGYLIMSANPQYGGMEFDIKDRDVIRVPYPYDSAIERYIQQIEIYKRLYG